MNRPSLTLYIGGEHSRRVAQRREKRGATGFPIQYLNVLSKITIPVHTRHTSQGPEVSSLVCTDRTITHIDSQVAATLLEHRLHHGRIVREYDEERLRLARSRVYSTPGLHHDRSELSEK